MNPPMAAPVEFLKMTTNALLCRFDIWIIAIIQDHQLKIAEDVLHWVIIRTAFGQRDPMEFQLAHEATGLAALTRVR